MTKRVALVVTGALEFRKLGPALERLFPEAKFFITPSLSEQNLKDSTSARVDPARKCSRHRKPQECPWDGDLRGEHPKKYLKYLCREAPPHEFCSTYKETAGGANALAVLDWNRVLTTPGSAPFLRALVEDLEHALGQAPALQSWPAALMNEAPTALSKRPRQRVLRNL